MQKIFIYWSFCVTIHGKKIGKSNTQKGQSIPQQHFSLFTRIIPRPYRDHPHTVCVMLRSHLFLFVDMFQYRIGSSHRIEQHRSIRIVRQSSFLTSPGVNCVRWGCLSSAGWNLPAMRSNCPDTFRLCLTGLAQTMHRTSPVFPCPPRIPASRALKSHPGKNWRQQYNRWSEKLASSSKRGGNKLEVSHSVSNE